MQDQEMSQVSVAVSERLGWRTDLPSVQIHGRLAEQCTQVRVASARGAMLREHAETATLQISASGRSALDWRLTSITCHYTLEGNHAQTDQAKQMDARRG